MTTMGLACTGADADSAAHYRRALQEFRCYIEDPVATPMRRSRCAPTSSWPTR